MRRGAVCNSEVPMRFLAKVTLLVALALVATLTAPMPTAQAQSQATIYFYNNTPTPYTFAVDDENICRVFVQYGSCSVSVSPGYHKLTSKFDNGVVDETEGLSAEAGKRYSWTMYVKQS
jgi:hypothetical protein